MTTKLILGRIRLCRKVGRGRRDRGRGDSGMWGHVDAGTWGLGNTFLKYTYRISEMGEHPQES